MNGTRRGYRAIGMGVAATIVASFGLVSPAAAQEEPPTSASGIVASLVDEVALTQAVEGFTAGDEASVAELAAVVAPEQGVDVDVAAHVSLEDGELLLAADGVVGEDGDDLAIGISYAGASQAPEIVDGVAVSAQVEPGLDIVARATDDGAQVLAVLADENAPTELAFDLDVPEGAELKELSDGSVNIVAPVETEVPLPGEEARFDAEIEDFILQEGITEENLSSLTEEQLDELLAIPDVETKSTVIEQVIATIESPWAVDANGTPLDTEFEFEGDTLIQKVQITSDTTFPVVLDPTMNWAKRLWYAGNCLGSIAALGTGAVAFVKAGVKFVKIVSTAKKGSTLYNAYQAYRALIKLTNTPFYDVGIVAIDYFKAYAGALKHGTARAASAAKAALARKSGSGAKWKQAVIVYQGARGVIGEVLGVNDCTRAITGK